LQTLFLAEMLKRPCCAGVGLRHRIESFKKSGNTGSCLMFTIIMYVLTTSTAQVNKNQGHLISYSYIVDHPYVICCNKTRDTHGFLVGTCDIVQVLVLTNLIADKKMNISCSSDLWLALCAILYSN
jgi:hypothetical protein